MKLLEKNFRKTTKRLTLLIFIMVSLMMYTKEVASAAKHASSETSQNGGASFYTERLEDAHAIYLTPDNFGVTPDRDGDDSRPLQNAINAVEARSRFGIVFIPEGTYQITNTVYVWKGIRLIGYGENRPEFVLDEEAPGFQEGEGKYMIHFASDRPEEGDPIRDANPGTFYSAISNVDFVIGEGNPSAIAIRSHFAQHSYIAHVDFHIGGGRAGIEKIGNEVDDCRFYGGEYGILTTKPSPSWPFLMVDSYFEGQRKAAFSTEEGGLTLIRNRFRNVPSAIVVHPKRAEELFLKDSRFEEISGPAVVISDEFNARPQFNFKNLVCRNVPVLARFRKSGKEVTMEKPMYRVENFTHGMQINDLGYTPEIKTTYDITPLKTVPSTVASDIPPLPGAGTWVNLASLGAAGDGVTDDTEILKKAIEQYQTIYLPSGRYLVTESIELKSNTVLIGLSPITTQIVLADKTPAFSGLGSPKPLLVAPKGGQNIVTGIGLDTGAFNERAVAAKWMAGTHSLMNDVRFLGGHGTYNADGSHVPVYNKFRTGDPYRDREWDTQYWSLWITDGGGGTFKDIWTPNSFAQAGTYISDTETPGRIYAMSVEHHVRNEVLIRNVSNWEIYDLQMEEESAESWNALPVRIDNSSNLTFANLYLYRVIRTNNPYPYGVLVNAGRNIKFNGIHVYSPTKFSFDNTVYDQTHDFEVRQREIARLNISGNPPVQSNQDEQSPVRKRGATVEKVVGGFEFIDGATADADGNIYFADSRWHQIYRWSPEKQKLTLVRNTPISPVGMTFDQSGNLLVTTRSEQVVAFHPDSSEEDFHVLTPVHPDSHDASIVVLPGHRWRDEHNFLNVTTYTAENPPAYHSSYTTYFRSTANPLKEHYVSPDGSTFLPDFNDIRRAFSLRRVVPGQPFYMADEFAQKTYEFTVNADGSLSNPKLFAERGELDVNTDAAGNVYIPAGQVFVYNPSGEQIDVIEVPERPTNVVFGGKDKNVLYITARSSLYKVKMRNGGRALPE